MSQNLVNSLASPTNHVAASFGARTNQLEGQRKEREAEEAAAQQQRDNDMLKVFEFAGDGMVNEARHYAQQKGVQVPDEIFSNADFSKGLATAGNFYGDDPAGAQRFTMAWMQTRDIADYGQRVLRASQLAGQPIDPKNRDFLRQLELERYKHSLKQGDARKDLFVGATKESLGGFQPDADAGRKAVESYDQFFGAPVPVQPPNFNFNGLSQGLMGGNSQLSIDNNNPGNMRPIGQTQGFQQFNSPQDGMQAMYDDLALKISGQSNAMKSRFGDNYTPTLTTLITTWAPPEENDTMKYINFVAQKTGISPEQQLSLQDIERIMPAMIEMEGGSTASSYYYPSGGQNLVTRRGPSSVPDHDTANIYSEAMMAISRGAPPEAVYNRLKQMGIDPSPIINQ